MVSRPEIEGQKLMGMLLGQNEDYGGAFAYITGSMGGGKTAALFAWLIYTLKFYPNQKIFFSETYDAPLQSFKIGRNKCHYMIMKKSDVIFRDRNNHLAEMDLSPTRFKSIEVERIIHTIEGDKKVIDIVPDFEDLYNKAKFNKVNIPFFGDRIFWVDFISYLRHTGEWNHVFIDELGEIVPSGTGGKRWKKIGTFANFAKDVRKCKIKLYSNTQAVRDLDYRVVDKFMYRVFLPGAMADRKHSRVTQSAIDNLVSDPKFGNTAYIDRMGTFGLIKFENVFTPDPGYSVEAHQMNIEAVNV